MPKQHVYSSNLEPTERGYVACARLAYTQNIPNISRPSQENLDSQTPEDVEGVGGQEQRRAKAYVIERCGKP